MACMIVLFCAATVIRSQAQTIATLTNFGGTDVADAVGTLVEGSDGNFYGAAGGAGNDGTIFRVTPDGTLTTLHSFNGSDGRNPQAGLLHATDDNFYGTTSAGGASNHGTVYKLTPQGTFSLLHNFSGWDGASPWARLVQGRDGNFYGTTLSGGAHGGGTVFMITPGATFTTLYAFCSQSNCTDGALPDAGLMQASDGNFYGTTSLGGSYGYEYGGTVFKLTPSGTLTTLYSFCSQSNCTDGASPYAGLMQASDGNFYGTTVQGGTYDQGTVFKMTPSGTLTSLYSFCSQDYCPDGYDPRSGVMQATDGTLYGTTTSGGVWGYPGGCGTIFKITADGNLTTLFSFIIFLPTDCYPTGLLQASNGNLYGLTSGLTSGTFGTFFQFYTTGKTLYTYTSANGTITSTDGIINCPSTCTHIYPDNTQVSLNATAADGWVFSGWNGACIGSGSCSTAMTQDQYVWASFSPLYTLTVTTNGNGSVRSTDGFINCPGVCSHVYVAPDVVQLYNFPAQGWSFSSWSGACTGSDPRCIVYITTGNASVGATFTQDSYTLTASISGQGTVTSTDGFINCPGTCSYSYLSFTPVTLNASPAGGWSFSGWSGACSGVGPCNITMTGNLGASAYFLQPGNGLQFISATPCRLVDTRQTGGPIQGGTARDFIVPQLGGCNIPGTAAAYSLNVTVVPSGLLGYLTIWPAGLAQPNISIMNSLDGRTKANAAIVTAGTNGAVSVFASDTTDVILDISGYFTAPGAQTSQFYALTPCRMIDTRSPDGELGGPYLSGQQQRNFPVLDSSCLQGISQPQAYSFNVTVVPHRAGQQLGYLTVWPEDQPQPVVSTLNNLTATTVANAAIVPAAVNGGIAVFASNDTDLVVDINGYFAAPGGENALSLYPTAPCRVLDTRNNNGQPFVNKITVNVVGGVCAPSSSAEAYVFNATVVPQVPLGYLTLWPDTQQQPNVSTLNAVDGWITSNMAMVPTANGSIDAFASNYTHLVLDISSYFAP